MIATTMQTDIMHMKVRTESADQKGVALQIRRTDGSDGTAMTLPYLVLVLLIWYWYRCWYWCWYWYCYWHWCWRCLYWYWHACILHWGEAGVAPWERAAVFASHGALTAFGRRRCNVQLVLCLHACTFLAQHYGPTVGALTAESSQKSIFHFF